MAQTLKDLRADICKFKNQWPFVPAMYILLLHPRILPVLLMRLSHGAYRHRFKLTARLFALLNQILFGCDIARGATIAGGLYLPHPQGVVIGEFVRIGANCIVHQGVTLGARGEEHANGYLEIHEEVEIATGAKILGVLTLGAYARIGANAVVLSSVPAAGVAVGMPARVVKYRCLESEGVTGPLPC